MHKAAEVAGIVPQTAYKWDTAEDVRESIDHLTKKYVSILPETITLSHDLIRAGNTLEKVPANGKLLELAARESDKVRQSVGITPSQTVPTAIINIMNIDSRQVHVSGVVGDLLRQHFRMDDTVIDADIVQGSVANDTNTQ